MMRAHRRCADSGSVTVELAVLAPIILLVGLLAVAAGRMHSAQQAVDHAAAMAAREASLARTPHAAEASARATANTVLDQRDLTCAATKVAVDTSGFGIRPGTLGLASVTVTCTVTLADLAIPGLPGSKALTATFASPLDPYRSNSLGFRNSEGSGA